jgi:hypothetical protein
MRTYIRFYNDKKQLVDCFDEEYDVPTTFENWVSLEDNTLSDREIKELKIYFYVASNVLCERRVGTIKYDIESSNFQFEYNKMYFEFFMNETNYIFYSDRMIWDNSLEAYYFIPKVLHVCGQEKGNYDEDEMEEMNLMDVLNEQEMQFLDEKICYKNFVFDTGNESRDLKEIELKLTSFNIQCKSCENNSSISVENMIRGHFICQHCQKK